MVVFLRPPRGFGVLTVTGRRSGKRRRRCVRVVRVGHTAYLAAIGGAKAQWLRNLKANPTVSLRIPGGTFDGVAQTLSRDEVDTARQAYCETVHPFDRVEYVMHMRGRPTPQRIKALHEHWFTHGVPVAVDLADTWRGSRPTAGSRAAWTDPTRARRSQAFVGFRTGLLPLEIGGFSSLTDGNLPISPERDVPLPSDTA